MFGYTTLRVMLALACLSALPACSQTPSQKFEAMYAEQKATAPEFAAITKPSYEVRDGLSDDQKMEMVKMWEKVKIARAEVEAVK